MKRIWFETGDGLYIEIFDPDPEVLKALMDAEISEEERLENMQHYLTVFDDDDEVD